ncbi:MAG TPA: nuclease-related domain-containing protein, partial [Actinomycetes bacterium]
GHGRADDRYMAESIIPGTEIPGGYAEQRYRDLRARWRRRVRPYVAIITVIGVAGLLVAPHVPGAWGYSVAFVSGGVFALVPILRNSPPQHVENWHVGAEGERWTAKELAKLDGWTVRHDLKAKYGNVDHLVWGPGGVYLIDSKNWTGRTVDLTPGYPVTAPKLDPTSSFHDKKVPRNLKAEARRTSDALRKQTRVTMWVQPVVAVWADLPEANIVDGVAYVPGPQLAQWLQARPLTVPPVLAQRLSRVL